MITKKLSNGVEIPMLGFGVYTMREAAECEECVREALDAGFRHIDTAAIYGNEPAVGKAIRESGIDRKEIFLTTKLWVQDYTYEKAGPAIDDALKRLDTDYLDLLLIHQPFGDIYGTWRAMVEAYEAGKVRSIGVSNMYPDRMMDLIMNMRPVPMVNQVRTNPYYQNILNHQIMDEGNVTHEAHSPFSQGDARIFEEPVLLDIAAAHSKSVGQVILRWLIQRDIVTLTRTRRKERMSENIDIFDFELTEKEMEAIKTLDRPDGNAHNHRDPEIVRRSSSSRYSY